VAGQLGLALISRVAASTLSWQAIVNWRKMLSEQGLDAGAATIAVHLAAELGSASSTATI
jgi:hypothetical protein